MDPLHPSPRGIYLITPIIFTALIFTSLGGRAAGLVATLRGFAGTVL